MVVISHKELASIWNMAGIQYAPDFSDLAHKENVR